MYPQYPAFNPEGERLLVRTLAEKLTREQPDPCVEKSPTGLRRLLSALRPSRQASTPAQPAERSVPCGEASGAVTPAR